MGLVYNNLLISRTQGFTLLEMLVVIMIMAMVMTIAGVNGRGNGKLDIETTGRILQSDLRYIRSMALVANTDTSITIDVANMKYRSQDGLISRTIPQGMDVVLTVNEGDVKGKKGTILFYPDGSSSGGKISLIKSDRKLDVVTSWLNGSVILDR